MFKLARSRLSRRPQVAAGERRGVGLLTAPRPASRMRASVEPHPRADHQCYWQFYWLEWGLEGGTGCNCA